MDKTNSKILTVSFALLSALVGLTFGLLLKVFAGAFGIVARFADSDVMRHGLPVGLGLILFFVLQFHPKVVAWADDVVSEIRKIVWASRKDTTAMTIAVLMMVVISAFVITTLDFVAGFFINKLMQ